MELICYALHDSPPKIIPAPAERGWMDRFSGRHPYKCLPLAIGNCYGWQILLAGRVRATWTGGMGKADVIVETEAGLPYLAVSNFSRGVLTFDVPIIFRTEPGYQLMVSGPSNEFKDGAAPMFAIIEAEWLNYTFTMNYQLTRPCQTVTWEKDEPFCQIAVVPSHTQELVEPVLKRISDNPEMQAELGVLTGLRNDFRAKQDQGHPDTRQGWQRYYFTGKHPDGRTESSHRNKMRLNEVRDER